MSTIPVSPTIISVTPGVIAAAGGQALTTGLLLTNNTRVPIGAVENFASAPAMASFFGSASHQASWGNVYFGGYTNQTQVPGSLLVAQYNPAAVSAYMQGGNISGLSLTQLQALTGSLTVVVDGYTWTDASISLTAATSFSNAASIIQTGLTGTPPSPASATGSIAAESASVTASIAGNSMYVTAVGSGTLFPGSPISGTGVTSGTVIDSQISGTTGGVGVYAVSKSQVVASTTISATYGIFTAASSLTGAFAVGQTLSGSGVTVGTQIIGLDSGTGGLGTYYVNLTQTASSTTITADGTAPVVTYDSISGAFIITSGIRGAASSIAYATGTLAAGLLWTAATGAILSQGAAPATPAAFMTSLINSTQNFATFGTDFDPDGGPGNITNKLAFALWNSQQNNRFAYVEWDTDPNPSTQLPATNSFGYQVTQVLEYSGTIPHNEPSDQYIAAFDMGMWAAVNWNKPGGRITAAFKKQAGLAAGVTSQTAMTNLGGNPQVPGSFGNGYNYVGAFATGTENYIWYQRGTISGPFQWQDTYINQVWLNQSFIGDIAQLLDAVNVIPYTTAGYTLVEESLSDTIDTALSSGVIVAGVQLSATEIADVNLAAGKNIATALQQQGWYFLANPASPSQRQSRTSPPFIFYYCDGDSIQSINMGSIVLQ